MSTLKTKLAVGIFVIIGFLILVTATIWLGMSHYLEKGDRYAIYFDQSVQGLDRDSAVKYRGVPVGRVEEIRVAPDGHLIEVVVKIEKKISIKSDIIAELKSIGITGIMFIELDHLSETTPGIYPKLSFQPEYPVIPSRPSVISRFMEWSHQVLKTMDKVDVEGLFTKAQSIVENIDHTVKEADLKGFSHRLNTTLENIDKAVKDLKSEQVADELVSTLNEAKRFFSDPGWKKALAAVAEAGEKAGKTITTADDAARELKTILSENRKELSRLISRLSRGSASMEDLFKKSRSLLSKGDRKLENIMDRLFITAEELNRTIKNLKELLALLSENPSSILKGPESSEDF